MYIKKGEGIGKSLKQNELNQILKKADGVIRTSWRKNCFGGSRVRLN